MKFLKTVQAIKNHQFSKLIRYGWIMAGNRLGLINRLVTEDRRILEEIILPHYADLNDIKKVLFVGTDWFTLHYEEIFHQKEYWTIDNNPSKRRFSGHRHILDSIEHLSAHFPENYFDLIVCNGVFGWGLNELSNCETAFNQCHICLRGGGQLVLGWNDVPTHCPFSLDQIKALNCFQTVVFPALNTQRYLANKENRHFFDFYRK